MVPSAIFVDEPFLFFYRKIHLTINNVKGFYKVSALVFGANEKIVKIKDGYLSTDGSPNQGSTDSPLS